MKSLFSWFMLNQLILITVSNKTSFIDEYINPSVRPYCQEIQEKIHFQYSFRGRTNKNFNRDVVYLFTKDKVFAISHLTGALQQKEEKRFVMTELFFNEANVKDLSVYWNNHYKNESYNTVFANIDDYNQCVWVFGETYRRVNFSLTDFKVIGVEEPISFAKSEFGFMRNEKIKEQGFVNIFGVDIAKSWSHFSPVRVYVRDLNNSGKSISFAFYNTSEQSEEFENGKHYNYAFDSAAYLTTARSLTDPNLKDYNHYFELRTHLGMFSLFDFTNNRDFLLTGANEELLGCPPSFCHFREFDDIIRLKNGSKFLIYREWMWNFTAPGVRVVWEEGFIANISSRQHKSPNFKNPFKFGIRHIVDGSFVDKGFHYIFRNGSFIKSESDGIIDGLTPFDKYTAIDSFFKGVPSETIDAVFYHKESQIVYFIKDDKYWGFSMANNALESGFPKHIEYLGLPYDFKVKSTFVEEDETGKQITFYFFTKNRFIKYNGNEFKSGKFLIKNPVYYCTSINFLGCPEDEQFLCPKEEETEAQTSATETMESTLESVEKKDDNSLLIIVLIIFGVIILLIVFGLILIIFFRKKVTEKANEEKPNNKKSNTGTQSEYSIHANDKRMESTVDSNALRSNINP